MMNVLVLGLGAYAFGKERRAILTFKYMNRVNPYFAISKWGDESVLELLKKGGQQCFYAPFGYLGRAKPLWSLIAIAHWPSLFYRIIRAYFRYHCKVIILICPSVFVSALLPVIFLKKIFGARIVLYIGDIPKYGSLNRIIGRVINKMVSVSIANSNAVREGLIRIGLNKEKTQVIYNGKDLIQLESRLAQRNIFRNKFGLSSGKICIAFIGQLSPNKGVEDFIYAASIVLHSKKDCSFLIVGEAPPLLKEFEQRMHHLVLANHWNEFIFFTGKIPEIEEVYAAVDVVVVPSRHEDPAPNVCIEAMASGVPVIATKVGGNLELIEEGITGFLVEKADPNQIAYKILQLIEDPQLRGKMGDAEKKRASVMFDIRENAALIERVICKELSVVNDLIEKELKLK